MSKCEFCGEEVDLPFRVCMHATVRIERIPSSPSTEGKPRKRRNLKKIGIALLAVITIGALLWYAPAIISYFQPSTNSSNECYACVPSTKVNLTLYQTKAVNISSGLNNKTNQYWFTYTEVTHPTFSEPKLTIRTTSQSKEYFVVVGITIKEFEIAIGVAKIESGYMVIYVKPLY